MTEVVAAENKEAPKTLFVSGTDTGVGKTVVAALLTLGLDAHYWKPIQSGGKSTEHDCTDSAFLHSLGISSERILPERYLLSRPLSPHLAARLDGKRISLEDFSLPDTGKMRHLIMEGAGGLLVPLNDRFKIIDLIKHLSAPVLLVARSGLGTINHTLLSIEALRKRDLEIAGVVMVGDLNPENRDAVERFGEVEVVAELPVLPVLNRETLLNSFAGRFKKWSHTYAAQRDEDLASVHADAYCRQPN